MPDRTHLTQIQVTPPIAHFKIHNSFILSSLDFKFPGYTLLWVKFYLKLVSLQLKVLKSRYSRQIQYYLGLS